MPCGIIGIKGEFMKEYHKIETLFVRDTGTKKLMEGQFRDPTIEFLKDNIWQFTEKVDGCLHAKSLINMADGTTKYIKHIKPGDLVYGYDTENGTGVRVVEVLGVKHQSRAGEWVKVKTTRNGLNKGNSFGIIHCTHDHKIWTKNRGYVEAYKLTPDDIILSIRKDLSLTPIQEQILTGKMLGDGTLCVKSNKFVNTASIQWAQKELDYTEWCLRGMQELASLVSTRKSGYGSKLYVGATKNTVNIYEKFKDWIAEGHKEVPDNIKLTPISLAFWYMDDGCLEHFNGQEDRVRFATNGFNYKSCELLIRELKKFDIDASIHDYKGNTICLNSENSEKLFLLIAPYICRSKQYKLPTRYKEVTPFLPHSLKNQYHPLIVEQKVLSIEKDSKPRERWDIETETHNFFTVGGLVHNTNIRIHWNGHKVEFGGRTDKAQIPVDLMNKLISLFGGTANEELFEQKFGETEVILFGEGFGPKIQKGGGLYRDKVDFILFDVLIGDNYQPRESVEDIANYFNLTTVPILFEGTLQEGVDFVKQHMNSIVAEHEVEMEGLVARPKMELKNRVGKRIIVKIKWEDFKDVI